MVVLSEVFKIRGAKNVEFAYFINKLIRKRSAAARFSDVTLFEFHWAKCVCVLVSIHIGIHGRLTAKAIQSVVYTFDVLPEPQPRTRDVASERYVNVAIMLQIYIRKRIKWETNNKRH